jgi:hypothetical protein
MTEGTFPKTDGSILYASEINGLQDRILEVYEGDGFDVTGTEVDSYEMGEVTTVLSGEDYVELNLLFTARGAAVHTGGGFYDYADSDLKVEIKEIGGAYSEVFDLDVGRRDNITKYINLRWLIALTAGMKSNGFQIKITGTASSEGTTNATVTNLQTVLRYP